jgi:hypothetical protein
VWEAFQIVIINSDIRQSSTMCARFADWLQGAYRQHLFSSSRPDLPDVATVAFVPPLS